MNHIETQRLFVRAIKLNCLLQFLPFDVNYAFSIFKCVPDFIDQQGKGKGTVCVSVQQLHLILIKVFSQTLPELKAS